MPGEPRPSLSSEQVRDPIGTLALAYGAGRNLNAVVIAIAQRVYPDDRVVVIDKDHPPLLRAEWAAIGQVVALLAQDGRHLARVVCGSRLPRRAREGLTTMVAACGSDIEPETLIEQVFAEIRAAVLPLAHRRGSS